ncbi:MAG: lldR [Planctomycetaceae bacterium]|nr:lldR [Planctomycetaceae bacterium]
MQIKKIPRNSLVSTVVMRIREVIESRKLAAGDRLPSETELAEGLGVSRAVVREAVGRMEALGFVSVQAGRGMYVGDGDSLSSCVKLVSTAMAMSPKELHLLVEFRLALECQAARQAAKRATPQDLADLTAICKELKQAASHSDGIAVDFRFHRKIAEISGNSMIGRVMEVAHDFIVEAMARATSEPRNNTQIANLHLTILKAIKNRDPDAAEQAMRAHLERHARRLDGWAD